MRKTLSARKPATGAPEPEPEKPAPKFTPRGGSNKQRLLIAVENDRIDFASMSGESAKRLNELMHEPEVQKQFGIGPLTDRFDPRHCKRIYEGLGHVLMGIGGFVFKWPESACEKFIFTEQEKDELAEPTAAALDDLAPKWLRENQSLYALGIVFSAIMQNKMRAAALEARRIVLERQQMVNAAAGAPPSPQMVHQPGPVASPVAKPPGRVMIVPTAASGIEPPAKPNGGAKYSDVTDANPKPAPPSFGGTSGKVGA